jgi:hypothetical protein
MGDDNDKDLPYRDTVLTPLFYYSTPAIAVIWNHDTFDWKVKAIPPPSLLLCIRLTHSFHFSWLLQLLMLQPSKLQ